MTEPWSRDRLAALAQKLAGELYLPSGIVAAVIVTDETGAWVGVGATCNKRYMDALVWCAAHGEDRRDHLDVIAPVEPLPDPPKGDGQ